MAKKRKTAKSKGQKKVNIAISLFLAIIISIPILTYLGKHLDFDFLPDLGETAASIGGSEGTAASDCEVHFIDVGQGDSTLIISDGKAILIDAGENEQGKTVVDYIKKLGIKKLDMIMVTHPHSDHMGGMDKVVDAFDIGKIVMPKVPDELVPTTRTYTDFLTSVANKGLKITPAKVGDLYGMGEGLFTILSPGGDFGNLNDTSLVTKFTYNGSKAFLFTGDIEKTAERAILATRNIDLKADVLKLAHHGSSTSTTSEFYEAVNPEYCVILVGDDNSYGHPNDKTLETIKSNSPQIYRTDYQGTIIFSISGDELDVKYEKQEKS